MTREELDAFWANWETAWLESGPHPDPPLLDGREPSDPEPMSAAEEAALDNWFEQRMEATWP
jgi:hypothetical protein